jgi:PAS domain S-box-containing protein
MLATMNNKIKILHLEDCSSDSELIHSLIERGGIGHDYFVADNEKDFINTLETENIDIILSDYSLPGYNGNEALKFAREKYFQMPFIFVSGTIGEDAAINAMLNGATDYVLKNKLERLVPAITRAMHEYELEIKRKQAEKTLLESEEKFRTYIECAPDGVFIIDNTGRYIEVNKSACLITGYSKEEIEKMSIRDLLADESLKDGQDYFKKLMETGIATSDLWHKHIDGSMRCLTINAVMLSETRFLGFAKDITNRKQAEFALKESEQTLVKQNTDYLNLNKEYAALNEELTESLNRIQHINDELIITKAKAEESDKLKSSFLANMSHEIRTPLTAIMGFSAFLLHPGLSNEKIENFVQIINASSLQLMTIISDIIDISKIETGQITIESELININNLLNELWVTYKKLVELKKLSLNCLCDRPNNVIQVKTDGNRVKQVLCNLLNNAIKFTKEGNIEFGYKIKGNFIVFYVKDTGIGISQENHALVFQRFRQVDATDNRIYGGNGLGLSISKALVEKLGGAITVDSELGVGSTFMFTVPFIEKIDSTVSTELTTKPDKFMHWNEKTILIVEDEANNHAYIEALLSVTNVNILHAWNGKEAVEQVKNHPDISLVLMDVKMPLMDGYEATRIIKKMRPTLPVIAQTAYALSYERKNALEAGCDNYISKPINRDLFMEVINNYLS